MKWLAHLSVMVGARNRFTRPAVRQSFHRAQLCEFFGLLIWWHERGEKVV